MRINKTAIARIMLCLMLTIAMVAPMAAPAEVYAAKTTSSSQSVSKARKQNISGITIVFSNKVIKNERLSAAPSNLVATGKSRSIKLTWTGVPSSKISGYYILRNDPGKKTWKQIATVKASRKYYTDKNRSKNKFYRYSVVAYKKVNGKIRVSTAAGWAGALTTRSKKNNVNSVSVSNIANVTSVMTGSCAQTYLKFPSKAYSTEMRWSSSNPKVASVDNNGLVSGVSAGTAVITARAHTGKKTDFTVHVTRPGTAEAMIETFYAWNGFSRLNGKHKSIIDIYNSITPWPKGYKMSYSDAWCDATVTAAAIKTGNADKIGRECSVPRHIKIFQALGIWIEDGTITPQPGDLIVYSWGKFKQPNNAGASHIGIVASVSNGRITAIEGNKGISSVSTREIPVGWGFIRGYARPRYVR